MELARIVDGLHTRLSVEVIPQAPAHPWQSLRVCDLTEDSRTVVPGSLFVARRGLKADGRVFVEQALDAGAVAILTDDRSAARTAQGRAPVVLTHDVALASALAAERFYGEPSSRLKLIGVTGTNGKTTVTWLAWKLLNLAGLRAGLVGTVVVDDGREVARAMMTTPPAIELSRTLATMAEAGCHAAIAEVSSHALDQKRADALRFHQAVFTNLTGDHLDYHGTMDNYAAAKARLFQLLPQDALAVVNAADPYTPRMLQDCRAQPLHCSLSDGGLFDRPALAPHASVQVLDASMHASTLRLDGPWGRIEAQAPLLGRYNAMNLLQAVCVAHHAGVPADHIARALPKLSCPPGRLELVSEPDDPACVFVDYAHSDDSLRNVLIAARQAMRDSGNQGRLHVVFGCGGGRDTSKRPRMGAAAAQLADAVVLTSDNPRHERPGDIISQVLAGVDPALRDKVVVHADRERAILAALRAAWASSQPGRRDTVIIAGKGHETEQILPDGEGGTIKRHFDDRQVARAVLESLRAESAPPPAHTPRSARREPLSAGRRARVRAPRRNTA